MALVLSIKAGNKFWVGDEKFILERVVSTSEFILADGHGGKHRITDQKAIEVLPEVFISAGIYTNMSLVRVVIRAPRSVIITREDRVESKRPRSMERVSHG